MTAIPSSAVRLSYLWRCNLAHAAFTLSQTHKVKLSADDLELLWERDCVNHPLLHDLGERPDQGFPRSPDVLLAVKIIGQEHNAAGMAA